MNYPYIVGLLIILIIIILFSFLSIYKIFIYSPVAQEVFIDPDLRDTSKECSTTPQLCTQDKDCKSCREANEVEVTCQDINRSVLQAKKYGKTGGKYCLPKKADQPCNEKLGGMWTWSGFSGLDGLPSSQEWDCLCTLPEIAASNGCALNSNICKGGKFEYDSQGAQSNTPPLPVHCTCPEGHVKIWTENGAILCVPYSPGFCADEKGVYNQEICRNFFPNPNDNICGLEPKDGVNDCGNPAPKPDHKINYIMCADLVDKKNKNNNCISALNDQMKTRGVSKCHDLSILDLSLVGSKCEGIPFKFTQNIIDDEKKNLCEYINAKDSCADSLKASFDSKKTTCTQLDYDTVFNLGKNCGAFPAEILSI